MDDGNNNYVELELLMSTILYQRKLKCITTLRNPVMCNERETRNVCFIYKFVVFCNFWFVKYRYNVSN